MTIRRVLNPASIDTIVATNLPADILSDLAAALAGSIGIAPTSNLDPTRENPSKFEPIHVKFASIIFARITLYF
jgi:tartrate dehydrogenase/decarboxylase/D-malate dehydrogenase